ncbi:EAL domain-containing protein [Brevibacillus sp. BC25]|uniref:EAL domain-containing protein n=1 Tax=Brevibacillus sp. BC25 TaxID=1144308 RepID=UPI0002714EF7|nr:EAL domain-containing protein [Brevibacillus sp. BC25]EJL25843.1 PAS domain S-box/diguanylate cyclase (GGDEF) domain-containing protein [Brevibacillus sp. BC25]
MNSLDQSYSMTLVFLSYFISAMASYTALDLGARLHYAKGRGRVFWLCAGAVSMGLGIWAMHFVAMLALHLPIAVQYDNLIVFFSIVLAVLSSAITLWIVSEQSMSKTRVVTGSVVIGSGIAGMHYTGMAAMMMNAIILYDWLWFTVSIFVAILVSMVALILTFQLRSVDPVEGLWRKIFAGLLMGTAITGLHYTSMYATTFVAHEHMTIAWITHDDSGLIATMIGIVIVLILVVTLASVYVDKQFAGKTLRVLESDQRYKSLFEHNYDGVIFYSIDGSQSDMNPAAMRLTKEKSLPLEKLMAMCTSTDAKLISTHFTNAVQGEARNYEITLTTSEGRQLHLNMTHTPVFVDQQITGVFVIVRDITNKKEYEAKINYLAFHDSLTGLPNRRFVEQQLDQVIMEAQKTDQQVYVLFLDLDHFKLVNDSLGHDFGDLLLQEASLRLQDCLGKKGTVSRLGGDEFMVILTDVTEREVSSMANEINQRIEQAFFIHGHELYITTSIGISRYPEDGQDRSILMRNADAAMYAAKDKGKNSFHLYVPNLEQAVNDKMNIQNELNRALARQEFLLHYQPQVSAKSGAIVGVEALIRWDHPERGLLLPDQFISVAEETGLIVPIGEWVLRTACKQNKQWQEQGLMPLRVAVNLSARQFLKQDFTQMVAEILHQTGLAPEYLELEITESSMIDVQRATQALKELKQLGVHVAIDDFGTGYSSLYYLKEFPLNRLKIDRSFVRDMIEQPSNQAIVSTIISMAHHLQLHVIAEGVETKEELAFLQEHLCEEVQGYLFSRPLPSEDVAFYLQAQKGAS